MENFLCYDFKFIEWYYFGNTIMTLQKNLEFRIFSLQIQSYAILLLIVVIIFYGFLISGRALQNTTSDLQDIRKINEQARLSGEILSEKFKYTDITLKFARLVSRENEKINSDLEGFGGKQNPKIISISTWLFNSMDDDDRNNKDRDRVFSPMLEIKSPESCKLLYDGASRKKFQELSLFQLGDSFAFPVNSEVVAHLKVHFESTWPRPSLSSEDERNMVAVKNAVIRRSEELVSAACNAISSSAEFKEVKLSADKLDNLSKQQLSFGLMQQNQSPNSDTNGVYLLLINRFGPLVIIFFFSSLLITLYKYNSRLVSFYYARLFAVKSLSGAATDDNFIRLASAFSPDSVDFGPPPRTPIDLAANIASQVVQKLDILKPGAAKRA
jgi:hypothetical protein